MFQLLQSKAAGCQDNAGCGAPHAVAHIGLWPRVAAAAPLAARAAAVLQRSACSLGVPPGCCRRRALRNSSAMGRFVGHEALLQAASVEELEDVLR